MRRWTTSAESLRRSATAGTACLVSPLEAPARLSVPATVAVVVVAAAAVEAVMVEAEAEAEAGMVVALHLVAGMVVAVVAATEAAQVAVVVDTQTGRAASRLVVNPTGEACPVTHPLQPLSPLPPTPQCECPSLPVAARRLCSANAIIFFLACLSSNSPRLVFLKKTVQ